MIPNHQPVIFTIHPWVCGFVCRYDRFPEFTFPFIWAMPHFRTTPRNPQGILRAAEPTRAFSFKPQSLPHKHSAIDIQRDAASGFGCPPAGERAKHPEIRRANQTAHVGLCRVHSPYGRGISQDLIPPPGLLFSSKTFHGSPWHHGQVWWMCGPPAKEPKMTVWSLICEAMHRWDSAHRLRCALRVEVWRVSPSTRKQWVKVTVTLSPVHITSPQQRNHGLLIIGCDERDDQSYKQLLHHQHPVGIFQRHSQMYPRVN